MRQNAASVGLGEFTTFSEQTGLTADRENLYNLSKLDLHASLHSGALAALHAENSKKTGIASSPTDKGTLSRQKPAPPPNTLRVLLSLHVQANNKYVRGRKRAIESIERFTLYGYDMETLDPDRGEYILTIPFETDKDLESTIYSILNEASSTADGYYCFIEADVSALDGSKRSW